MVAPMPIATPSIAATSGVSQRASVLMKVKAGNSPRPPRRLEKPRGFVPRRERAARSRKHDRADRRIAIGLPQGPRRRQIHGASQRVLFFRPIEGHAQDRAFALDPDVWRLRL